MWITKKQLQEMIEMELLKKDIEYTIEILKKNNEINYLKHELNWKRRDKTNGKVKG